MKKIFLALCIAAICASPSTAQDYDEGHISRFKCHRSYFHRHESGLVLGFPNRVDRSNRYEDFIKEQQYRYLMDRDILMFPSITLNGYYLYHFNDRIAVGGLMGWNPMFGAYMEHKVYTAPSTPQDRWRLREVQSGYIQGHIFSLMPTNFIEDSTMLSFSLEATTAFLGAGWGPTKVSSCSRSLSSMRWNRSSMLFLLPLARRL